MPRPATPPIGMQLARAAKTVSRAFDEALVDAGGSLPAWLVLLALKTGPPGNQRALAEAVGIRGATLTHHLDAMEADGLVARTRDPDNRRSQHVTPTPEGEKAFLVMRQAAAAFDRRLRREVTADEAATLGELLERLAANAVG